jgi:hypothetical protein
MAAEFCFSEFVVKFVNKMCINSAQRAILQEAYNSCLRDAGLLFKLLLLLFVACLMSLLVTIAFNDWMIMRNELERM